MSYHKQSNGVDFEYDMNPYDSFMRNHLKHYGYYTGRNENYRTPNKALKAWDRGYEMSDGESDTEYENQGLKDADKNELDKEAAERQKRTTQLVFNYSAGKMVPKLREPRNLYALSKDTGPQQAPRWPADIEVLPDRVVHVEDVPTTNEPFYQPSGFEKTPMPLPEGEGRVVYNHPLTHEEYFLRSRIGGNRNGPIPRAAKLKSADDTTLIFESRFESGNLMKAIQVSEFEYELELRYDLYTHKHTQWFYFRFSNTRRNARYRFTITNFMKSGSLYNSGMRPVMYSEHNAQTKGEGWRRVGEDIKYYKNDVRRKDLKGDRNFYYSLTWTFTTSQDNDTCYFAHCYPYTYSDLQDYLQNLTNDSVRSKYCKQRMLCRSLAGNFVYVLTITSPSINPDEAKVKKAVVVTARVHPGETNASWMMKGFLDYLTSELPDAKLLRDLFVFKIVPMLNPDGVIVGNYRCSLAGRDLNRNYKTILKDSFPSVTHTKAMIKKLMEEREVVMYCDLHGHSRKQNVFIYGCNNKKNPDLRLKERIFPIILYNNAANKFNYNNCKFKVQKSKEGTGRVVVWQMGIMNSYTMEASFCGSTTGDKRLTHFTTVDFEAMGYHFCDSLLDYCDPDETKCDQILAGLEERLRQEILAHLERTGTPLPQDGFIDLATDYPSGLESSTTGSDSSADDGLPVHLIALAPKLSKKKKLKTRKERDKKRNNADKGKEKEKEKSGSASSQHQTESKETDTEKKTKEKKEKDKLRYRHGDRALHSAGRTRQPPCKLENGPPYIQERNDVKNLKKTEYLEALTNAYLMSGILKPATDQPASLRYSVGNHSLGAQGLQMGQVEGLCPHHEKALAEQFVANQLAGLTFADDKYNWSHTGVDTRRSVDTAPYHSAPARDRRTPSSSDSAHPLNQGGHPRHARSPQHSPPRRLGGARPLTTPSKTIVAPVDGVMEEKGDNRKAGSDFIKRGVSTEAMALRTSSCPSSTNYSVHESGKSLEAPRQALKMMGRHGNGTASSLDRPPSMSRERPINPMTPSGYQEMLARKVAVSLQKQGPNSSGSPHTAIQKTESSSMAGQILTQSQHVSSDHSSPNPSGAPPFMSPSTHNWPPAPQTIKNHNCTTEATPISDPALYLQNVTPSSHHFQKAQDFYGGTSSGGAVSPAPTSTQSERYPSPANLGSAARLQAKYGRKVGSAAAPQPGGESPRSYRGTLHPGGNQIELNPQNSNNNACTTPDDDASNEMRSTSSDGFGLDQTSSAAGNLYPEGSGRDGSELVDSSVPAVSQLHALSGPDQSKVSEKSGQGKKLAKKQIQKSGSLAAPAKRPDQKAEFKGSADKSSEGDSAPLSSTTESPSPLLTEAGGIRTKAKHNNRYVSPTPCTASKTQSHSHPSPVYSQTTPRSKVDSTSPLQRSPRLLDRSTIQRGVDGSIQVKKSTRKRVTSGVAMAHDLQDLNNGTRLGDLADLDILVSVDDNPYVVSMESSTDPSMKDITPHPVSARSTAVKSMSIASAIGSYPHSPRGKTADHKSNRPLSSRKQHSAHDPPPPAHEAQDGLNCFSVSKLSLQNRSMDKTPQMTPRSPVAPSSAAAFEGGGEPTTKKNGSIAVATDPHWSSGNRGPGAPRPKTHGSVKHTPGAHGKARHSPSAAGPALKKSPTGEREQDAAHVVVHQGGFMGHRSHPSHLKVQYSKRK